LRRQLRRSQMLEFFQRQPTCLSRRHLRRCRPCL
jgi:hypothetical protein